MGLQLILLPEQPIIVSDDKIKVGDNIYEIDQDNINIAGEEYIANTTDKKIIAGIPGLPSIDFNGLEDEVGYINLLKLASDFANLELMKNELSGNRYNLRTSFMEGFEAAQSLGKEFTKEDMMCAYYEGTNIGAAFESICDGHDNMESIKEAEEYSKDAEKVFINFLNSPKTFDIEVEAINNKIKIIKIL